MLYYYYDASLIKKLQEALAHREEMEKIRIAGQQLLMSGHLYKHRVETLFTEVTGITKNR